MFSGISPLSVTETSPVTGTATILAAAKSKPVTKPKKKATKSHFPNMFRAGKQSSQADVDDLLYLNTQLTGKYFNYVLYILYSMYVIYVCTLCVYYLSVVI